jgi:hypothetical protein
MKSLYNIHQEYLQLASDLEEAGGELTPELESRLEIHQADAEVKLINYSNLIDILESNVSLADAQIERIQTFKKAKKAAIDRFKHNMLQALLSFGEEDAKGIKRLEYITPDKTLNLATRRSKFVDVFDEGSISDDFLKIDISNLSRKQYTFLLDAFPELVNSAKTKIAKKEIGDALKKGEVIEGASLDTRYSLTIK